MTPEQRIENFTKELIKSAPVWYDGLPLVFPGKDIKQAIKTAWITLHAEGTLKPPVDWKACRNLVNKTLTWQDPKNPDGFEKAVPVEIHPQALTGEARAAKIKEFLEVLAKVGNPQTEKNDAFKHVREDWKAPEGQKYHPPSAEEIALIDLKVQYGRACTDKVTGKVLPGMPKFEDWLKEQQ